MLEAIGRFQGVYELDVGVKLCVATTDLTKALSFTLVHGAQVLYNQLGGLCLSRTTLSTMGEGVNQHTNSIHRTY